MCHYIKWVDTILNHVSASSIKVELDLSNYATKAHLKKSASVDTSEFPKKTDIASLKWDFGELDRYG